MKQTVRYLLILVIVMALWNTIIIKPLKIFTVFLHELGHTLMAVIFGGGIKAFHVSFDESGYAITASKGWFSSFMIANGGYLGSILFALLILYLKRTAFRKYILGTVAILFLGVAIKYGDSLFTIVYAVIFAGIVLLLYMLQKEKVSDWAVDVLGIASVAYAVYDTFIDTILLEINRRFHFIAGWGAASHMTDAARLYQLTHVPAIVWGVIWLLAALFAVDAVLFTTPGSKAGGKKAKK